MSEPNINSQSIFGQQNLNIDSIRLVNIISVNLSLFTVLVLLVLWARWLWFWTESMCAARHSPSLIVRWCDNPKTTPAQAELQCEVTNEYVLQPFGTTVTSPLSVCTQSLYMWRVHINSDVVLGNSKIASKLVNPIAWFTVQGLTPCPVHPLDCFWCLARTRQSRRDGDSGFAKASSTH